MATICWMAMEYDDSGWVTSRAMFSFASASSALRLSFFHWILPNRIGCRPMNMFSATDRLGQRLIS